MTPEAREGTDLVVALITAIEHRERDAWSDLIHGASREQIENALMCSLGALSAATRRLYIAAHGTADGWLESFALHLAAD